MKGLSKSRYTAFCQCPKNLWLKVFKGAYAEDEGSYIKIGNFLSRPEYKFESDRKSFGMVYWVKER